MNAHLPQRRFLVYFISLLFSAIALADNGASKNVILIIGDGFDDQHVTMGRNYLAGMSGTLTLDKLPFRGAVQVETLSIRGYHPLLPHFPERSAKSTVT